MYTHTHTHIVSGHGTTFVTFLTSILGKKKKKNKYTGSPLKNKYVSKFEHIKNRDIFIVSLIIQTGFDIK